LDKNFYDFDIVKDHFEKNGYTLISKEYKRAANKMETMCPNGHSYFISAYSFIKLKSRCPTCKGIKKYTLEEISDILRKEGYVLLSKTYRNAHQKLEVICPNGHKILVVMNAFLSRSTRCGQCSKNHEYPPNFVKDFVEKEGYLLQSDYDPKERLKLLCPKGHFYHTSTFYNFKKGRRCPDCSEKGTSKPEKDLSSLLYDLGVPATLNSYDVIPPFEIDVYCPSQGLAIEYSGLYWHSEDKKDRGYHRNKQKMCNEKGIRLITIFEDEWLNRESQVRSYLKSVLNKNEVKLFARKTELREVAKKEGRDFLETYHIQGATNFEIAFGLYSGDDLVAIMTGGPHHRQGLSKKFVLNRLAFKANVSISGGASRLLKSVIDYAKKKGYRDLISWSDNRWSEGKVYETMGFTLEEEMGPDYSYVKRDRRFSKQSCQKKNLIEKGAVGTMANTERELALSLGMYRIWDCGKKRWVMDLSK
jgi:GNAT superfamily N-acetyltransferase